MIFGWVGAVLCLSAGVQDSGSDSGYADVDGGGWVGAPVDLGEFVAGAGQADLESFGFAVPAFAFGFGDAGVRAVRTAAGIGVVYGRPAYRCRHGYSSATVPDPARPKNAYVREDQILPHLAAIAILLAASAGISGPESGGSAQVTGPADGALLIDRLRADGVVLTYDPYGRTLHAGGHDAPPVVIGKDATDTHSRQDRKRRTA